MKKNKLSVSEKQTHAILTSLRELLERGPWANSAFLRVLGKKIQKIHDDFSTRVDSTHQSLSHKSAQHHLTQKPSETQKEVFVALYSSDGANLESWEKILVNLPRQTVSRPVYSEEEAIKKIFKDKKKPVNDAYVVMYIDQNALLMMAGDKAPKDRFGTELLTLKAKALSLDHMLRFVHTSGVYTYQKGRLIKVPKVQVDE